MVEAAEQVGTMWRKQLGGPWAPAVRRYVVIRALDARRVRCLTWDNSGYAMTTVTTLTLESLRALEPMTDPAERREAASFAGDPGRWERRR